MGLGAFRASLSTLQPQCGHKGSHCWSGGAQITVVCAFEAIQVVCVAPPAHSSGNLSEGDKRDSKGNMPEQPPITVRQHGGFNAAEATLLRSQRLGLGRGGSFRNGAFGVRFEHLLVAARLAPRVWLVASPRG